MSGPNGLGYVGSYSRKSTPRRILDPTERRKRVDLTQARRIGREFLTPVGHSALTDIIMQGSVMVRGGNYNDTCEPYLRPSRDNVISLRRDVRLFPLTAGLLQLFATLELTQRIFEGGEDSPSVNHRKKDNQMIGWLSVFDALNMVEVINDVLRGGGMKLRFPTELSVLAFLFDKEGWGREHGIALFHTSNYFLPKDHTYTTELAATRVNDQPFGEAQARVLHDHVFVYRCSSLQGKVSRYAQQSDTKMNTGIFYEVVTP